ncbi:aspartate carbamoyltransferase [Alkalithermobacter thermoalcaliphilus JW-YL-7 = DSM 7308]|uniref:Aspartate carbamoyltransferase n=1 Tax=Alkalithermobacter thermoalcaliphilus JW-YL-7 = DSM 7308 TaxID=1121328 RepID=A0A150FNB4_CLOPD|nr:Aspartate carbamoyltransferase [[Clostridium] paradoxum JW-YL-7 = DSM 7308]SHK89726.1 aspartate carbamoyltransferase [[Clostridium] paradoxum JW-YL-7 = DSM 7308]
MLKGKHLIDLKEFSLDEIKEILDLSKEIMNNPEKYNNACKGKILATLFYEPSTRTRLSFEAAMIRLGGSVIGFSDPNASSVAKGESLEDTIRTISSYADIVVIRHFKEGASKLASQYSSIPVINAGDGSHLHPTQTLTDLLTIKSLKKDLSNHKIAICGDLKYGRTVHSLVDAIKRYENNKLIFVSPPELKIPEYIKRDLDPNSFKEISNLDEALKEVDILYMTRIQRERFRSEKEYFDLKDSYVLTESKLKYAKEDMIIMHPLPRVNEISPDIDKDKRSVYFEQVRFGMFARMALIIKLLGVKI